MPWSRDEQSPYWRVVLAGVVVIVRKVQRESDAPYSATHMVIVRLYVYASSLVSQ